MWIRAASYRATSNEGYGSGLESLGVLTTPPRALDWNDPNLVQMRRLLEWLGDQSGLVVWRNGVRESSEESQHRQAGLIRYAVLCSQGLGMHTGLRLWFPPVHWSVGRFLGLDRPVTATERASWSRTVRRIERQGLVTREGATRGGHRRTNYLRLTAAGAEALRDLAAARGAVLNTTVLRLPEALSREATEDRERRVRRELVEQWRFYREGAQGLRKYKGELRQFLRRLERGPIEDGEKEVRRLELELELPPIG